MTVQLPPDERVEAYLRYARPAGLPRYERPPVTHVSLGFHFQGFNLRAVDMGYVKDLFHDDYPVVEEAGPMANQIEYFGGVQPPQIQLQFTDRPPTPMCTFLDRRRGRLVQVQADRFTCAWRKVPGDETYPEYGELRRRFVMNALAFERYADSLGDEVPDLALIQAEITYVNDVPLDGRSGWATAQALLRSAPGSVPPTGSLPAADEFKMAQTYTYANPLGVPSARLHVAGESVWTETGPVYRLALTFRGQPAELVTGPSDPFQTLLDFYDAGHAHIVTAFSEVTSEPMHEEWGRLT